MHCMKDFDLGMSGISSPRATGFEFPARRCATASEAIGGRGRAFLFFKTFFNSCRSMKKVRLPEGYNYASQRSWGAFKYAGQRT